jgi:Holliday junction resolvase RusA-like endonuclease
MSWKVVLPGQPPSLNHSYKIIRVRGHMQFGKYPQLVAYQTMVSTLVQQAKPKDWAPTGQIRIRYWFHVKRDIDCDNSLKAINDAIAIGLGVQQKGMKMVPIYDDKRFLPCVVEKTIGNHEPYVEIELDELAT